MTFLMVGRHGFERVLLWGFVIRGDAYLIVVLPSRLIIQGIKVLPIVKSTSEVEMH